MSVASNLHFSPSVSREGAGLSSVLYGRVVRMYLWSRFIGISKVLFISLPGLGELFRQFQTRAGTVRFFFFFWVGGERVSGWDYGSFLLEFAIFFPSGLRDSRWSITASYDGLIIQCSVYSF